MKHEALKKHAKIKARSKTQNVNENLVQRVSSKADDVSSDVRIFLPAEPEELGIDGVFDGPDDGTAATTGAGADG
jgi:hypothetical protein